MKTVFEILPETLESEKCTLTCELSTDSFSYAIRKDEENKIISVGVHHYEKTRPHSGFPIALQIFFHQHKILSEKFKKSCLIYSVPRNVLIPFTMYNSQKNAEALNLVHGDLPVGETILNDILPGQDMYNTYSVSKSLNDTVFHQFPAIRGTHQFSAMLKKENPDSDKITAIFYQEKVVVILFKDGKYQLLNSFFYRTPEDVVYILLNICRQFDAPDIPIEVVGFIEENSALYKSIYDYFSTVKLIKSSEEYQYEEGIAQYPVHFFNHLYEFDVCE